VKVLFVLEHYDPYIGGAEKLFRELAVSLVREGHSVSVVTTRFLPDLPLREVLDGVTIHRVRCFNRFFFSFLSLPSVLRAGKTCDVIQTTSYNAALPAWLASVILRKPAIITFHEVWGGLWWKLPFIPMPLRLAYSLWESMILKLPFDKVIAVSEATRRSLLQAGIRAEVVERIYNGLDYSSLEGVKHEDPDHFVCTYFGRLGTSKGLELLIPAIALHLKDFPDSRFNLVIPTYPAGLYRKIRAMTDRLGDQVVLHHDLPKDILFEMVRLSTCVVIPSHSEGFCFAAAEAVAIGVPVVSSEKAALAEVTGGKVLPIEDLSVSGLKKALQDARNGSWKEKPLHRFYLHDSVRQYMEVYAQVADRP